MYDYLDIRSVLHFCEPVLVEYFCGTTLILVFRVM